MTVESALTGVYGRYQEILRSGLPLEEKRAAIAEAHAILPLLPPRPEAPLLQFKDGGAEVQAFFLPLIDANALFSPHYSPADLRDYVPKITVAYEEDSIMRTQSVTLKFWPDLFPPMQDSGERWTQVYNDFVENVQDGSKIYNASWVEGGGVFKTDDVDDDVYPLPRVKTRIDVRLNELCVYGFSIDRHVIGHHHLLDAFFRHMRYDGLERLFAEKGL